MNYQQKDSILALLKMNAISRNYNTHYWFSYTDFLDSTDYYTDFSCERLDGKLRYITLIESLLAIDETARVYVQVYGFEDDQDDNKQFIYADTLIIFSKLPLDEIKHIFNESQDIRPSNIGEVLDCLQSAFLIGDDGKPIPSTTLLEDDHSVYFCWWD